MLGRKRLLGFERVYAYDPQSGMLIVKPSSLPTRVLNLAIKVSRLVAGKPQTLSHADLAFEEGLRVTSASLIGALESYGFTAESRVQRSTCAYRRPGAGRPVVFPNVDALPKKLVRQVMRGQPVDVDDMPLEIVQDER